MDPGHVSVEGELVKFKIVCELEMAYEHGDEKDVISRRYEYAGEGGFQRFLYMVEHFDDQSFKDKHGDEIIHTQISRVMVVGEYHPFEKSRSLTQIKNLLKSEFGIDVNEVD